MSGSWTFFTNHGHIIFLLSMNSKMTVREVALNVGITERATQKLISDLEKDGYIKIKKIGRQTQYTIVGRKRLKHTVEKACLLQDLIDVVGARSKEKK